ncbi:hypothetical protein Mapa_008838 [Marchantia paleacea]|nr:hypothetical protein Mapa_008838 [Marchantia paleacea]
MRKIQMALKSNLHHYLASAGKLTHSRTILTLLDRGYPNDQKFKRIEHVQCHCLKTANGSIDKPQNFPHSDHGSAN